MKALADDAFAGPRYARFAEELARYGISVLQGFMCTGWVFVLTARLGFPLHPTEREQAELAANPELRRDLATMTVAQTLPRFRAEALLGGGWKPTGASLTSYFTGACLRVFPNEFRRYRTAQRRWDRSWELAKAWGEPRNDAANTEAALGAARVQDILRSLEPRPRAVLLLTAQGYSQAEIAEILGFSSAKAVEGVLYRLRQRAKRSGEEEDDGTHH
ncbi:sigma factor-like helix-turn-helix DNA-binding protein [Streptomyces sp. NPDC051214]|uniref:sigma factor-like helix-turn-helix DNA-binding protein n=1 Tax=Streptomyces sp. NPDC051214 TaxID=3155282 RepID=UPI0034410C7C